LLHTFSLLFRLFVTDSHYKVPMSLYPQIASQEVMDRIVGPDSGGGTVTGRGQVRMISIAKSKAKFILIWIVFTRQIDIAAHIRQVVLRTVERVLFVQRDVNQNDKSWSAYFKAPKQVLYDMQDKPIWTQVRVVDGPVCCLA
jgi:hypothetical protein